MNVEKYEECPRCFSVNGWHYDRQLCGLCGLDRLGFDQTFPNPALAPKYEGPPCPDVREALRLVLLFHNAGHWSDDLRAEWLRITGTREASTKVMCDHIRAVLSSASVPGIGIRGAFNGEIAIAENVSRELAIKISVNPMLPRDEIVLLTGSPYDFRFKVLR